MSNDESLIPGGNVAGDSQWSELDDTVADGPSPVEVPEEAREWIAEQRVMHGLLRAVNTADASARESRIESVLAHIDVYNARAHQRHWFAVAAAALLFATFSEKLFEVSGKTLGFHAETNILRLSGVVFKV